MTGLVQALRLRVSTLHLVVPDALKVNVAVEDVVRFEGAEVIVTDGDWLPVRLLPVRRRPCGRAGEDECCQPEGRQKCAERQSRGRKTFPAAAATPGSHAPDFGNDPRA